MTVATAMGEVARVINFDGSVSTADKLSDNKCNVVMGPAVQCVKVLSTQACLHVEAEKAPPVMNVRVDDNRLLARSHLAIEKARPAIELVVARACRTPLTSGFRTRCRQIAS